MRARRVGLSLVVLTVGVSGVGAVALAGSASAALPAGCSQSGITVTCRYSSTGAEQQFVVPAGVWSINVSAVGGRGGAGITEVNQGGSAGAGGLGASASGAIAVISGETLYVEVGGNGQDGTSGAGGAGGFNGGGNGATLAGVSSGGGGGASDVRSVSCGGSCPGGTTSLASRLLVAAGGGGGGAAVGITSDGNGGNGGAAGSSPQGGTNGTDGSGAPGSGGVGGGAGSLIRGGTGGAAGTSANPGGAGADGGAGQGGSGQVNANLQSPGGGGGGGYNGGGGGGSGAFTGAQIGGGGGGGAGWSSGASVGSDSTGVPLVAISYTAAVAGASPASLSFGTQPQSTLSAPRTVTLTNTAGNQLLLDGLTFTGADPQDFLITSNGCLGPIAAGGSCTLGVSFAPQGQGARTATLLIATNDPNGPASVTVSGTGGQLPQGPPGQPGPPGQTGAPGPAGKIELVVCTKLSTHASKHTSTVQHCTTKLVSGTVKFTLGSADLGASVSRAGITYATGTAIPTGTDHWQLVLTRHLHALRAATH